MSALELNNAGEKYRVKFIKEGQISWDEIWAIRKVNLSVDKGQTLGVIGQNGSGKTTLLKLIAGMLIPDTGTVKVSGKVSAIMELGAGFNPEFTGRENITVNARIYGLEDAALKQAILQIVEFADLDKFIDAPIKYYSQGMYMRLAFALAIFVEPDILLIDDILAVGDEEAQQKCIRKIFELKKSGKTIIVVSHDMNMINKLCDRVILLEGGSVIQEGAPARVIPYYLATIGDKKGVGTLEAHGLRVVFNNGRLTVNHNGNLITKEMGSCVYSYQGNFNVWIPSSNLEWKIKKTPGNKITAEGLSPEGRVTQVWSIQIEKNQLQWHVEIKDSSITDAYINLFLTPEYKEWMNLSKEGVFPEFTHKTNWQDIALSQRGEATLGLSANNQKDSYPDLLIALDSPEGQTKLFNSGYEQEARVVQLNSNSNVIPVNITLYSKENQLKDHIQQAKNELLLKQEQERSRRLASQTINSGPLRLFADLETKALRIFYKEKELTRGNGLHSSFLFDKSWYNTSNCDWQVEKEGDTLILRLYWHNPELTQTWKLRFEASSLIWESASEVNPEFSPLEAKFGLCVCSDYKSFFCASQVQDFPGEFTYWQDMPLEDKQARWLGLNKQADFPAIVFENNNFYCHIQNSDSQSRFRVVQLALDKDAIDQRTITFASRLNFLEDEKPVKDHIQQAKNELLLKQEQERSRRLASQTINSGPLRLFADLETKALRIFYKEKELTRGNGLHSSFRIAQEQVWSLSSDAKWTVQKESEEELIIKVEYLSLSQIWRCACKDERTVEFVIELEVSQPLLLANHEVRIELQDEYNSWHTGYEEGNFSSVQYINNLAPIRLKNSKISRVILKPEGKKDTPDLLLETKFPLDKHILGMYKRQYPDASRTCLNFSLIIPKNEENIEPGKYTYFIGSISLGDSAKIEDQSSLKRGVELNSGSLRFLFDQGRGRIFLGDRELTTGLGVYTSVRSLGMWCDSYQAVWKINSKSDNKITAAGNWPYVPISQHWEIELVDKNSILLTVDMEVHEQVYLEIEQTNLMLSAQYREWQIPQVNAGKFLDEYTRDYDILPFRFWYGKTQGEGIKAMSAGLPAIWFKCSLKNEFLRMIAENTDYIYKGRLLQYQQSNADKIPLKRYPYFSGVIKIEP